MPGVIPQYITPNSEFTQTFSYILPEAAFVEYTIDNNTKYCSTVDLPGQNEGRNIPANINLVAYVAENDSDVNKRAVINAAEDKLWNLTYIPKLSANTKVDIFPNPGSDIVSINFNQLADEVVMVEVLDLNGRLLKSNSYKPGTGQVALFMDVAELQSGLHLFRISTPQLSHSITWVKQ